MNRKHSQIICNKKIIERNKVNENRKKERQEKKKQKDDEYIEEFLKSDKLLHDYFQTITIR